MSCPLATLKTHPLVPVPDLALPATSQTPYGLGFTRQWVTLGLEGWEVSPIMQGQQRPPPSGEPRDGEGVRVAAGGPGTGMNKADCSPLIWGVVGTRESGAEAVVPHPAEQLGPLHRCHRADHIPSPPISPSLAGPASWKAPRVPAESLRRALPLLILLTIHC